MVISWYNRVILVPLTLTISSAEAAKCDPNIAVGAAAVALSELAPASATQEWDILSYQLVNYKIKGPEVIPIRLGQSVITRDGISGTVQRIENSRNVAILDQGGASERYVAVDLQSIHPANHGAKPIKVGSFAWTKFEGRAASGKVDRIDEESSTAFLTTSTGVQIKVPVDTLFKDISGTKRVFYATDLRTLTGSNSILDHSTLPDFLKAEAFESLPGIQNLQNGLRLYGLSTEVEYSATAAEYFLKLNLDASDPDNTIVRFLKKVNESRTRSGFKPIKVDFRSTNEGHEVSIIDRKTSKTIEQLQTKKLDRFGLPKYFNQKKHRIEIDTYIDHASFNRANGTVHLSHSNLFYLLKRGGVGQSLPHEVGHANSLTFPDSFDAVSIEAEDSFLPEYPEMLLDENWQHLRTARRRLIEMAKGRTSINLQNLKHIQSVMRSIRRTSYFANEVLLFLSGEGTQSVRFVRPSYWQEVGSASITLKNGTRGKFPLTALSSNALTRLKALKDSIPVDLMAKLDEVDDLLILPQDVRSSLTSFRGTHEEMDRILAYIALRDQISKDALETLKVIALEMQLVYQSAAKLTTKVEREVNTYLRVASSMDASRKATYIRERIVPDVISIWKRFTAYRSAQVKLRKNRKKRQDSAVDKTSALKRGQHFFLASMFH